MAITAYADANAVISKHLEDGTIPTAAERQRVDDARVILTAGSREFLARRPAPLFT